MNCGPTKPTDQDVGSQGIDAAAWQQTRWLDAGGVWRYPVAFANLPILCWIISGWVWRVSTSDVSRHSRLRVAALSGAQVFEARFFGRLDSRWQSYVRSQCRRDFRPVGQSGTVVLFADFKSDQSVYKPVYACGRYGVEAFAAWPS